MVGYGWCFCFSPPTDLSFQIHPHIRSMIFRVDVCSQLLNCRVQYLLCRLTYSTRASSSVCLQLRLMCICGIRGFLGCVTSLHSMYFDKFLVALRSFHPRNSWFPLTWIRNNLPFISSQLTTMKGMQDPNKSKYLTIFEVACFTGGNQWMIRDRML